MTLVPLTGGVATPRLAQSVVRGTTTFSNTLSDITIESRFAIVYADGNVVATVRGRAHFKAGSYDNLTIEPIADTHVTGPSATTVATSYLRYIAQENLEPVTALSIRVNSFRENNFRTVAAGQVVDLDLPQEESVRITAANYVLQFSVDGVNFGALLDSTYQDQYITYVAPAGQYKKARLLFTTAGRLYVMVGQDRQHEFIEMNRLVLDPPGIGSDFNSEPHDTYPYMDGFVVAEARSGASAPNGLWYPVEPEFRNLKEPVFLIVRGVIDVDWTDVTSRFEVTLGREETGVLGNLRYWHVAQAQWFRSAAGFECGERSIDFVFGLDVYEPITHVRVRNIYPPYVQSLQHGKMTLHVYAVPHKSISSRSITVMDTPNQATSVVKQ